jgi:hypothetical protein
LKDLVIICIIKETEIVMDNQDKIFDKIKTASQRDHGFSWNGESMGESGRETR